jgi:hypothetical protein
MHSVRLSFTNTWVHLVRNFSGNEGAPEERAMEKSPLSCEWINVLGSVWKWIMGTPHTNNEVTRGLISVYMSALAFVP